MISEQWFRVYVLKEFIFKVKSMAAR